MIDIYYPYFQREAIWEELRYSIRSVEKHCKFPFRIFIVGDKPYWLKNVIHIQHERCEGIRENTTYDAICKLNIYLDHLSASKCFVRMYDDTYILKDVSWMDLANLRSIPIPDQVTRLSHGIWIKQLENTLGFVIREGFRGINTETHFPEYFINDWMKKVIKDYDALENRLLTSTLYHNTFFNDCYFEEFNRLSNMGIQFYGGPDGALKSSNDGNLFQKCEGKMFLNHNNPGLNQNLKNFLMAKFPEKSSFEV